MNQSALYFGLASIFLPVGVYVVVETKDPVWGLIFILLGAFSLIMSMISSRKEREESRKEASEQYLRQLRAELKVIGVVGQRVISEIRGIRQDLKEKGDDNGNKK